MKKHEEEAKQLVERYKYPKGLLTNEMARQCALIAVDEMLNYTWLKYDNNELIHVGHIEGNDYLKYEHLKKVKTAIEKI